MNTTKLATLISEEILKLQKKNEEMTLNKESESSSFYELGKLHGKIDMLQTLQFTLLLEENQDKI